METQPDFTPILVISPSSGSPTNNTSPDSDFFKNFVVPCIDVSQMQDPVVEFGVAGGVPPHTVKIFADGQVVVEGATVRADTISPLTVKALIQLANAENFWILPEFTGEQFQGGVATQFVKITLPCISRHVDVRGGVDDGPFAELYSLMTELIGVVR